MYYMLLLHLLPVPLFLNACMHVAKGGGAGCDNPSSCQHQAKPTAHPRCTCFYSDARVHLQVMESSSPPADSISMSVDTLFRGGKVQTQDYTHLKHNINGPIKL